MWVTDDWGTQLATFISPDLWNDFFKPRYARIFAACRKSGWHVWFHSCGKVNEVIDGLIEAGVDTLNLMQPRLLGIEEIGRRFAGRVCFCTGVDIQQTLPSKTPAEIRAEARMLLERWGTEDGGMVVVDYASRPIGTTLEKRTAMFNAFRDFDRYKGSA